RQTNLKKIRILIADDHGLVRHGAGSVLRSRHGWRVVGEAANGREAVEAVERAIKLKPDVAYLMSACPNWMASRQRVKSWRQFRIPRFLFSRCTSPIRWYAEHWRRELADNF